LPTPVVSKVGFIREKGKATARELLQSLEAGGSLHSEGWGFCGRSNSGLGRFFSWPWIRGLSQVNWFGLHLYWGRGNNLESILLISPVADLCLSFRMQECRPPSPRDAGMTVPSMGDGTLTHLP
jgi:hypothetical protein